MTITLNGTPLEAPDAVITIADLLKRHPPAHRGYAVEVNNQVIPRSRHISHEIHEGDVIEIVTLVGGG